MAASKREDGPGLIAWMEGLPCSGKTTLSRAVAERLKARGAKVEILDGDEVRQMFSPELGFSRKDRELHARRVSYVARMLARNGVVVLVAMITPYETSRQTARAVAGVPFVEVWLRCPLDVCRQRDPKGLYRKTQEGQVSRMTGVDDPFEEPLNPDLVIDTNELSVLDSVERIVGYLESRALLGPSVK